MANMNTISLAVSVHGADRAVKEINSIGDSAHNLSTSFKNLALNILYLTGAYKAFQALLSIPLKGFEAHKEMETARLSIASVIAATQELITTEGERLKGMEKIIAAQQIAKDLMKEIQIAGLETVATTEELVEGFQTLLAPASAAGLTLSQTKDLTIQIVQAMGALGIHMNQLSAEGRSLLDGTINPMQDRLAVALGITSEMVKEWIRKGELYERLSERLEAFRLAGSLLAETWSGLASNMREAIAFIGSELTAGVFEQVKEGWKSIINMLIDTKNFDVGANLKNLISVFRLVANDIGLALRRSMEGFVSLLKTANDYVGKNKDKFLGIYNTVKGILEQLVGITSQLLSLLSLLSKAVFETGANYATLKAIHITLAGINDVLGYFILGVKTVALALTNAVLSPLQEIMNLLGKAANFIKQGWGDALIAASSNYRNIIVSIGESWEKSVMKYKDGIAPHVKEALSAHKRVEESLIKQNIEVDKFQGSMKSLVNYTTQLKDSTTSLAKEWERVQKQLQLDIDKFGKTEYEQRLIELTARVEELRAKFGDKPIIQKWFDVERMKIEQAEAERIKRVLDELQLSIDKFGKTEVEQKMIDLIAKVSELRAKVGDSPVIQKWFDIERMKIEQAEAEKLKQAIEEIKTMEEEARIERLKGKERELAEVDRWYAQQLKKYAEYQELHERITEIAHQRRLLIAEKYAEEEMKKRLEAEKKLYDDLEQLTVDRYRSFWQMISDMNKEIDGELGKGFSMLFGGLRTITDIATGQDFYTQELQRYEQFLNDLLALKEQGYINDIQFTSMWQSTLTTMDTITAQQRLAIYQGMAQSMAGIMFSLYVATGKHSKAMFNLYKAFAIAEAIISTHAAAARALKDFKFPLSLIVAAIVTAAGMARVAAIAAQKPGGSVSVGSVGRGGATGSVELPTPEILKPEETTPRPQVINIHVYGNVVDHDAFARELIPAIQKAQEDNVR